MKPLISIITPTTGSEQLRQACQSVWNQTYDNIEHIVVVDGPQYKANTYHIIGGTKSTMMCLPHNTGANNYNGHRIYGAFSFLAEGDYICFLDEDNWIEPNHIESLVNSIEDGSFSCSLRKIVDQEGNYVCNDDCESLGNWKLVQKRLARN